MSLVNYTGRNTVMQKSYMKTGKSCLYGRGTVKTYSGVEYIRKSKINLV